MSRWSVSRASFTDRSAWQRLGIRELFFVPYERPLEAQQSRFHRVEFRVGQYASLPQCVELLEFVGDEPHVVRRSGLFSLGRDGLILLCEGGLRIVARIPSASWVTHLL